MSKPTCPKCGKHDIATIENITGYAGITDITDGSPEWDGYTKMDWDSSETVGICCRYCGHSEEDYDYNNWTNNKE